jgi:TFIIF-interacting CTD phosphatase-like protein
LNVEYEGTNYPVFIRKRPYLEEFLDEISGRFEVVVYTASAKAYAGAVMQAIDP